MAAKKDFTPEIVFEAYIENGGDALRTSQALGISRQMVYKHIFGLKRQYDVTVLKETSFEVLHDLLFSINEATRLKAAELIGKLEGVNKLEELLASRNEIVIK